MIGRSTEMEKIYRILSKVAQSSHPVLILGRKPLSKELVARTVHAYGPNAQKPFLPVDCGSPGTHADRERTLRLRQGRIYRRQSIPENWPPGLCRGRHRVSRRIRRAHARPAGKAPCARCRKEVRPLARHADADQGTHCRGHEPQVLRRLVENGTFRKDLFYRPQRGPSLPCPLCATRREDIPLLAARLLDRVMQRRRQYVLSNEALRAMMPP